MVIYIYYYIVQSNINVIKDCVFELTEKGTTARLIAFTGVKIKSSSLTLVYLLSIKLFSFNFYCPQGVWRLISDTLCY